MSEKREQARITYSALGNMLGVADAQGRDLTALEMGIFNSGIAQLEGLRVALVEEDANRAYWGERLQKGHAEPGPWVPTPAIAGQQLGLADKTIPSPEVRERLQRLHRALYVTGGQL